jgi:hypothetical protein
VRRASEAVPVFVGELLAPPGIPQTISDTMREQLAGFPGHERAVLEVAVLRRHFDWEILPAASGQSLEAGFRALARVVDWVLVTTDAARFQFCHVPAREAVLMFALPPRLRRAAANAAGARCSSASPRGPPCDELTYLPTRR